MLAPDQILSLTIDKPAAGGRMIARADGHIVLVAGAIPGERVLARVERVGKGVVFAETIGVEDGSPDRREPFVELRCGGSLLAHIAYPRQLAIKSQVIADAFTRIGRAPLRAPVGVMGSPEEGYRMRARLHVRGHRAGFFREGSHDICDARETRQLLPETCDTVDRMVAAIASLGLDAVREIELSENVAATERVAHLETSAPVDPRLLQKVASVDGLTPGPYVSDTLTIGEASLALRRHVLAFFQGNRHLLHHLVAHVSDRVPIGGSVLDLYAGAGLFSMAAAVLRAARVVAIEGDRYAADDLHANASASGGQVTTVHAAVEMHLARASMMMGTLRRPMFETVIVDPPRTGMSREALERLLALAPPRLVYVSCDVATLARDARRMLNAGYTIERADAFDLFPNTPHVETVVVFTRQP